jgi:hypothetical protein
LKGFEGGIEMEPKTLQFAAVMGKMINYGMKLDKTGRSAYDKQFDNGKMSLSMGKRVCHCFLSKERFYAVEFNVQHSAQILPVVPLKVKTSLDIGKEFVNFKLSEVMDYKRMSSVLGGKRLVMKTINDFFQIRPVTDTSIEQAFSNRKLICKIHEGYEKLGIKSAGSSGYTAKYDEPFLRWFHSVLAYHTKQGDITRRPGLRKRTCPKHKRTCKYVPEYKAYFCEKCQSYIPK